MGSHFLLKVCRWREELGSEAFNQWWAQRNENTLQSRAQFFCLSHLSLGSASRPLQSDFHIYSQVATFFLTYGSKWRWKCYLLSCNPILYCSLPVSSVPGIFQARILEWVAIPFSRGSSWPRDWTESTSLQAYSLPSGPPVKPSRQQITWLLIDIKLHTMTKCLRKEKCIALWPYPKVSGTMKKLCH